MLEEGDLARSELKLELEKANNQIISFEEEIFESKSI
jgi:hypothetical protein